MPIPYLLSISITSQFLLSFLVFFAIKWIYRLTLHPLAQFPGPKLAAVSSLYGAYFDLSADRSYVKELPALHDRYGPIVRAWPNHLHVRDMDAYNQIYKIGTKFDKDANFYGNPCLHGSLFNTPDTKTAVARKNLYGQAFSKEAVRQAEPTLREMSTKFLNLLQVAALEAKPVDLTMGFRCLTSDTIMNFMFLAPLGALDAPNFQSDIVNATESFAQQMQWEFYFPNIFLLIFRITKFLPSKIVEKCIEPLALSNWLQSLCRRQIVALQARANPEEDPSILDGALNPKLRKGQTAPTTDELTADALLQILAGTDTTAHTLTIAVYHVLANPSIHQSITRELCTAMPTKQSTLDGPALETLPYLHALIKESLRFAYGAPGRLPRIVPSTGATFCGHPLPPGTVVSASHYVSHHNPAVFGPDEFVFRPERWLGDDVSDLERNMVSFSRGSRACAGMNLAYAELRIVLAHLFRRFELSLWRTTSADMEWKDCYVPNTKGPLKVMIKEASD